LEQRLSHTSRIIVKEAGHMVPITHPVETADAISSFWAE
jgi:pimeloyl-ACP methyl ester carboxylesterase